MRDNPSAPGAADTRQTGTMCSPDRYHGKKRHRVMTSTETNKIFRFNIEGQEVVCYQMGNDRLWVCKCEYFQERLRLRRQGYCPHMAAAIIQAMDEGTIEFVF